MRASRRYACSKSRYLYISPWDSRAPSSERGPCSELGSGALNAHGDRLQPFLDASLPPAFPVPSSGSSTIKRGTLTWETVKRRRLEQRGCVVVLFSPSNLRVLDNYPLTLAIKRAMAEAIPVVGLFVFDGRTFAQPSSVAGFFRRGPQRARFLIEAVKSLRAELEQLGMPLLIRTGYPEFVVPDVCELLHATALYTSTEYAPHEHAVQDSIRGQLQDLRGPGDAAVAFETVWDATLVHIDDLVTPVADMQESLRFYLDDMLLASIRPTLPYNCNDGRLAKLHLKIMAEMASEQGCATDVEEFNPYTLGIEDSETFSKTPLSPLPWLFYASPSERNGGPQNDLRGAIPTLRDLGYGCQSESVPDLTIPPPVAFAGGTAAGLERVDEWLSLGGLLRYAKYSTTTRPIPTEMTKPLLRVSPWIATGCVSPRMVQEKIREYCQREKMTGRAARWFHEGLLRLGRRDFWHWMGLRYGRSLFFPYGPRPEHTNNIPDWRHDEKVIRRWCAGITGVPFADAAMRELTSTGWVASEGRQALAWLLTRGYGQDWRAGAEWFERCSLDYDPFVCYGNFAYFSELICDDIGDPVFSASYLAHKADQTGLYCKTWLPQLAKVPPRYIHRPHVLTARMQSLQQVLLGQNYPYPIKLWEGAEHSLTAKELTAYFSTAEQLEGPGWGEAFRHGTHLVPQEHYPLRLNARQSPGEEAGDGRPLLPSSCQTMAMYAEFLQRRSTPLERTVVIDPGTGLPRCVKDIWRAAIEGDLECLHANLQLGVDVNARGQPDTVYGPRFDKCEVFYATPLHYACGYGREEAVRFLLERGARTDIRSASGLLCREYAKGRHYTKILALLDNHTRRQQAR